MLLSQKMDRMELLIKNLAKVSCPADATMAFENGYRTQLLRRISTTQPHMDGTWVDDEIVYLEQRIANHA